MKIHHIGYAVSNLGLAIKQFTNLGYVPKGDPFNDEDRKVQIQFLENRPYIVELVSPLDNCSPVSGILKKMGSCPYHICYETDDIQRSANDLLKENYHLVGPIKKAPAIRDRLVAFLYHKDLGIIELIQTGNT